MATKPRLPEAVDHLLIESARVRALRCVLEDGPEYRLRQIQRWYSRSFSTPLAEVNALPLEEVIGAYFEDAYGKLEGEDLEKEVALVVETAEESRRRVLDEGQGDASDDAFFKKVQEESKAAAQSLKAAPVQQQPLSAGTGQGQQQQEKLGTAPAATATTPLKKKEKGPLPSPKLPTPAPAPLPPDIHIDFLNGADFEALLADEQSLPQPPRFLGQKPRKE